MPSGRICLGCGTLVVGMTAERCGPCDDLAHTHRVEARRAEGKAAKDASPRGRARRAVYRSREWKAVRLRVIQRDGGTCRLCGTDQRLTVHHIRPAADDMAAALDPDNLVTLCARCHGMVDGGKAARTKAARKRAKAARPRIIGGRS